jgi:hypothetical protein
MKEKKKYITRAVGGAAVFSTSKSASIISKKDLVASIQYRTNFFENID